MEQMLAQQHRTMQEKSDRIPMVPRRKASTTSFSFRKAMNVHTLESADKIANKRDLDSPNRTNMSMLLLMEMFTAWSEYSREKRQEDYIVGKIQERLLGTFYKTLAESAEAPIVEDMEIFRTVFDAWKIYYRGKQREKLEKRAWRAEHPGPSPAATRMHMPVIQPQSKEKTGRRKGRRQVAMVRLEGSSASAVPYINGFSLPTPKTPWEMPASNHPRKPSQKKRSKKSPHKKRAVNISNVSAGEYSEQLRFQQQQRLGKAKQLLARNAPVSADGRLSTEWAKMAILGSHANEDFRCWVNGQIRREQLTQVTGRRASTSDSRNGRAAAAMPIPLANRETAAAAAAAPPPPTFFTRTASSLRGADAI
jgi:hypothetical protein